MNKKRNNRANKIIKNKKVNKLGIIGVIAAITIVIGLTMSTIKFPSKSNASSPIDGIQCNSMEQSIFHIHSHLSIFINGQNYTIPSLIGITNSCFYWMHTHDKTGIIHIEVPVNKTFSLGQFFDIWKTKFNNNQIFNNTVNNAHQLMVYVNGTKVPSGTNYRDIVLHDHDVIAIVYGPPSSSIPIEADFSSVDVP